MYWFALAADKLLDAGIAVHEHVRRTWHMYVVALIYFVGVNVVTFGLYSILS